jgi:hypothetical protein|tara:strand:+ start:451 stop:555 length:105 start_codon:yes stop_codon:yes gene_type:complete
MGRRDAVTAVVIIEAIAWMIFGFALLLGIVEWLG